MTAPYRHGPFEYYTRTFEGKSYPVYCRRPLGDSTGVYSFRFVVWVGCRWHWHMCGAGVTGGAVARAAGEHEQVLVDGNKDAEGLAHCDIIEVQPSPDHTILAYAVDTTVSAGSGSVALRSSVFGGDR